MRILHCNTFPGSKISSLCWLCMQVFISTGFRRRWEMKRLSGRDESHTLGFQLSSTVDRNDHSSAHSSTPSADSISYLRTYSQSSTYSDRTDDNSSYSGEASPTLWPVPKLESGSHHNQAVLTRLGMKQHKHDLDIKYGDESVLDSGRFGSLF